MVLIGANAWADEITATLVHTASSGVPSATAGAYVSTIDAENEYINNGAFGNKNWQGAAYAEFSFEIPAGHVIQSASMVWKGVGSSKDRTTDVLYVNTGLTLDYTATGLGSGTAEVNLGATKIETVTFPKNTTKEFTTDVTNAVKAVASSQSYIIFKFTNNVGSGNLVGKGATSGAPTLVITTTDASSQTKYTVKFTDGTNEIKDAVDYDVTIGSDFTASSGDMASFIVGDKKYIYVSGNTTSTAVADATSNVITLVFREAAIYNYTISSNLGTTLTSATGFEGEIFSAGYPRYQLIESKLYEAPVTNKEYRKSIDLSQDNVSVTVDYTEKEGINAVFYSEAESLEGATTTTTGNLPVRASNAAGAISENNVTITSLAPGKYKFHIGVFTSKSNFDGLAIKIGVGEEVISATPASVNLSEFASNEFELKDKNNTAITFLGAESTADTQFDYIWIEKTGDVVLPADPIVSSLIKPSTGIATEFTSVADLAGVNFAIINKAEGKALYGSNNQNLAYDTYASAFSSSNSGYLWKLVSLADDADADVHAYYRLRLITPKGEEYNIWGSPGYLNSQPAEKDCSFILGLEKGNGQDMKNGAVYDVQYVEGQGFTIKNIGTGLYQGANNGPAKNENPTYFTFATVSNTYVPAVEALLAEGAKYKAIVKDEAALTAYDTAIDGIDVTAITGDGLEEAKKVDAAITELAKAVPAVAGQDYTRTIANPSFELGNVDGWTNKDGGWSANNGNFGAATGSFFVEKWTAAPGKLSNGSLTQVIAGLPAGKYKLTAEMQNREQGNNDAAGTGFFLVANTAKTEAVASDGKTFEVVGATKLGALEIGAKFEDCSGNWACVDNFTLTMVEPFTAEYSAAEKALADAITEAKALDTTGKEGADALATAITTAESALNADDSTVDSFTNAKTALNEAVAAYILANTKVLTLKAPVGEEVTLTIGVWNTEDTFTVDFGGENNVQKAKVGIDNKGPVKEDGTTASATKFTGTVGGDGTIKVSGVNDIWYLVTTNGAIPTSFDQEFLMNVVQMSITGADVESVALPAYPKMTQFSFNNSSAKSVDVTKVPTLTSLTINSTTASKFEPQLESIDLSKNTELTYLSLQGNTKVNGKLTTLDLTNNTKLDGMGLYVQYNALTEIKLGENTLSAINVQNNQLTSLDWTKLTGLKNIYASNNKLAGEADLSANAKFENVQLNNNELTSVKLPDVTKQLAIEGNKLTLATIPAQPAGLNTANKTKKFTYASQAALEVAETVSELDLTSQLTVAKGELNPETVGEAAAYTTWLENQTTTFSFVTAGGTALIEGTDYEVVEPGKFKFLKAQEEKVHAVMLNAAFPKFTEAAPFTTTEFTVEAASGEELEKVKVTYALKTGEAHVSADVVEVKNEDEVVAKLTFGEAEGADFKAGKADTHVEGFEAFTEGNGTNGNNAGGTFYTIVPKFDGKIDVAVVLNADKKFYILEDGTALADFDGITVSEKKYGTFTFDVKAEKAYKIYAAGTKLGFYGFNYTYKQAKKPEATELELTLNVERYTGMGYNVTEATVDFTEAKAFLGVEAITEDMLSMLNPDGTTISDYASIDGWFNGEGAAESWGNNTKICVKFFEAIAGEGKYSICDMNGADEVGKTYSVKWQLEANGKKVIYTINVTFVEKPVITLTFADLTKKDEQTVALTSELGRCYEGLTADVDVAAILAKLEVSSLNDVTIYAVQSNGSLDDNYKLGNTDGWRNAAGDWQGWGNDAYFYVKADFAKESAQIYEVGGMENKNTTADWENPASYTATYAFVKTGTTDAVVLKVTLTYTIPTGINAIATDAQKGVIYNMNGQKVNKAKKGLFIINGKKTVVK